MTASHVCRAASSKVGSQCAAARHPRPGAGHLGRLRGPVPRHPLQLDTLMTESMNPRPRRSLARRPNLGARHRSRLHHLPTGRRLSTLRLPAPARSGADVRAVAVGWLILCALGVAALTWSGPYYLPVPQFILAVTGAGIAGALVGGYLAAWWAGPRRIRPARHLGRARHLEHADPPDRRGTADAVARRHADRVVPGRPRLRARGLRLP